MSEELDAEFENRELNEKIATIKGERYSANGPYWATDMNAAMELVEEMELTDGAMYTVGASVVSPVPRYSVFACYPTSTDRENLGDWGWLNCQIKQLSVMPTPAEAVCVAYLMWKGQNNERH